MLEDRYIVAKRKHFNPYQEECLRKLIFSAACDNGGKDINWGEFECLVIEKDWPEYPVVLKMLEDRVNAESALSSRESSQPEDS